MIPAAAPAPGWIFLVLPAISWATSLTLKDRQRELRNYQSKSKYRKISYKYWYIFLYIVWIFWVIIGGIFRIAFPFFWVFLKTPSWVPECGGLAVRAVSLFDHPGRLQLGPGARWAGLTLGITETRKVKYIFKRKQLIVTRSISFVFLSGL